MVQSLCSRDVSWKNKPSNSLKQQLVQILIDLDLKHSFYYLATELQHICFDETEEENIHNNNRYQQQWDNKES